MTDEEQPEHPCRFTEAIAALRVARQVEGFADPVGGVEYALGAMEQHAAECAHKERLWEKIPDLLHQAVVVWFEIQRARDEAKTAPPEGEDVPT